jgi:hypothetical protein
VKFEQILGRHVQEMRQASGLSDVLVMSFTKSMHLVFDARVARGLGRLDRLVGAHAVAVGWLWQVELVLTAK